MADRALALVNTFSAELVGCIGGQLRVPGNVVGIDIQNAGFGIECWSSPFSATVESRENDCRLLRVEGNKLSCALERSKLCDRPLVRLRRSVGQHVFGQDLARIRCGLRRKALLICSTFPGEIALRIFLVLDGKERLAGGAIEKIDESLLAGLSDSIDVFAVMLDRDQYWRRREVAVPYVVLNGLEMPD